MARLIVSAVLEGAVAGPDNQAPNYVIVSAPRSTAYPSPASANVTIDQLVVGPGGSLVDISSVSYWSTRLVAHHVLVHAHSAHTGEPVRIVDQPAAALRQDHSHRCGS